MENLKIPYPIVVEGKYDRERLNCVLDAQIIKTDGFGIFKKSEKLALLRALSAKTKIIVLSDSDGAGKVIRSHISSAIPKDRLIHLYIPKIEGKEKRKAEPSKEGTLGVEGMTQELLYSLFAPYADDSAVKRMESSQINKIAFYEAGLSGGQDSAQKRDAFASKLGLPSGMTANALLAATVMLIDYEKFIDICNKI